MQIESDREQQHAIADGDRGRDKQTGFARRAQHQPHRVCFAQAVSQFFAQSEDKIDRVVCAYAHRHRRAQRIADIQIDAGITHHAEIAYDCHDQRQQHHQAGQQRTEHQRGDDEHHRPDLHDVEYLAMHHHFVERRTLRHAATDVQRGAVAQSFCGEGLELGQQCFYVGTAVGLQESRHVRHSIIVVNVGIKIARLARHRIQQQILRDQIPVFRYLVERWIVAVHRLIHALDEVGHRYGLADIRLLIEKLLDLVHRLQHLGILDRIFVPAFDQQGQGVGAADMLVQELVIQPEWQIFCEIGFG